MIGVIHRLRVWWHRRSCEACHAVVPMIDHKLPHGAGYLELDWPRLRALQRHHADPLNCEAPSVKVRTA